jgi:signal peptidase II
MASDLFPEGNVDKSMHSRSRSPIYLLIVTAALVVVALDQITKEFALSALADGPIDVISGWLTLRLTYNSGGAFGLLQGLPEFFLIATLVVVVLILFWARRLEERSWAIPLGMILGGGLGNVTDRVVRDTGGRVVDFVDLHWWPVFNFADASIVIGVGIILLISARRESKSPREHSV